jgi:ligand-binding sensor domain-containing protein
MKQLILLLSLVILFVFAGCKKDSPTSPTNNDASWTAVNTGLTNTFINVSALTVSGTNLFAGTYGGGVFLSTDNGTSWTITGFFMNTYVYALAVSPNGASGTNLFAGTDAYGVFLSTNIGTSWNAASTGLTETTVRSLAVSGTNLFAGTYGGVFLSTNNGKSWTAANTGLTNSPVNAFIVSPNGASGTNLFAGTNGGGVFLSTNNGVSWTTASTGLPSDASVYTLAVFGMNLFAGTWDGVFLSTNNGTNWTAVCTGLTNTHVVALVVSPNGAGGTNLFAGTSNDAGSLSDVFLSTNNGTSWTATGLPNNPVNTFAVSGAYLFAGTSRGVWRRPL